MKEPGAIERNRPEFCRSLRITPAIWPPIGSPWKSTIAIGTGSKLGRVMSMVSCAVRRRRRHGASAAAHSIVRRCRGSIMSNLFFWGQSL